MEKIETQEAYEAYEREAYEEPKESKYREEDDIKIARRIAEIAGNRAAISQTSDSEYVDMSGVDGNEFEHAASPMQGADAKIAEQPQKQLVQKKTVFAFAITQHSSTFFIIIPGNLNPVKCSIDIH